MRYLMNIAALALVVALAACVNTGDPGERPLNTSSLQETAYKTLRSYNILLKEARVYSSQPLCEGAQVVACADEDAVRAIQTVVRETEPHRQRLGALVKETSNPDQSALMNQLAFVRAALAEIQHELAEAEMSNE